MNNKRQFLAIALLSSLLLSGCATNDPFDVEITVAEVCAIKGTVFSQEFPSPYSFHYFKDQQGATLQLPTFAFFKHARSSELTDVYVADLGSKGAISDFTLSPAYHFSYTKSLPGTALSWTPWILPKDYDTDSILTPKSRFMTMPLKTFLRNKDTMFAHGRDCAAQD